MESVVEEEQAKLNGGRATGGNGVEVRGKREQERR